MTKEECKAKIKEMLPDIIEYLTNETTRLINSGGIDLEDFETDSFASAKILLTVAIENLVGQYAPLDKGYKEIVKNLRHF